MTKRYGNFQHNNGKKPKLDDDEPWGDDVDDEFLDKCFEIATQKCQDEIDQSRNNSILPSYDAFKNPAVFSSSTQANITVTATASTSTKMTVHELEAQLQKLQEQNKEKDGEICILRSKIRDSSKVVQDTQQKTISEWREKLLSTQREANLIKSDLEFKNLEIANLKQQLAESRRLNLDATLNNTQQFVVPEPVVKVNHERPKTPQKQNQIEEPLHKDAIVESCYPLKCISPNSFKDTKENHVIKNTSYNISRNTIPYLQNQPTYNESCFHHKCAKIENRRIGINCIYPEILKLVNCTSEELNGENSIEAINKVLYVELVLLQDLDEYLVEFGSHLRTEDIQQADTSYLIDEKEARYIFTKVSEDELGIQSGKIMEVLSKLILYNSYSADFICGKNTLKPVPNTKEYAKLISNRNGIIQNYWYLLKLVYGIIKSVGKYRIANRMHSFLLSVVNMLISIGNIGNGNTIPEPTMSDLFCSLFKEIIFARPGQKIIERITFLLKMCSTEKYFVQYLFRRNNKVPLQKADPKGILFYTQDACSFCVLSIRLQLYLTKTADSSLEVYYNIIVFMYNTFKTSSWIHHENPENVCGCLSQLYKLEMEFMFRALEKLVEYYNSESHKQGKFDEWYTFFHHEIIQKVLNQINFNNFELSEKYVIVYSQFKEIEAVVKKKGYTNFTQLNTSEELPKIPSEKFRQDF